MIDKIFILVKKILPKAVFKRLQPVYHWLLSFIAPMIYGYPSDKLIVIGVTGTKGKSTICFVLARILETAGKRVGMSSGVIFKVGDKEWLNDYKMTMPGRMKQQKLLKDIVNAGCDYAIIETTSEGIKQYRHAGINYDIALFTNLYPEHIESHGSFEKYREAKGKLFYHLTQKNRKKFFNKKISIVNSDDNNSDYFSFFPADEKYNYCVYGKNGLQIDKNNKSFKAEHIKFDNDGSSFSVDGNIFHTHLLGEMNVYNVLGAISIAKALEIPDEIINKALQKIVSVPGRIEFIDAGQDYNIIVDYAHDPESLRQLFLTLNEHKLASDKIKLIHVFGATGGGRDKAKRAVMGNISAQYADVTILTNDDPYQENENEIIEQIYQGMEPAAKVLKIIDRQQAIKKAMDIAQIGDLVVVTGKGSEQAIMLNDGRHQWDDRKVIYELLKG